MKKIIFPTVLSPVMPGFTIPLHNTDEQYRQSVVLIEQAFDELQTMPCLNGVRVHTHLLTGIEPVDLLDDDRFADVNISTLI